MSLNRDQFGHQLRIGEEVSENGSGWSDFSYAGNVQARTDAARHALRGDSADVEEMADILGGSQIPLTHFRWMETRPVNVAPHEASRKGRGYNVGSYDHETHTLGVADGIPGDPRGFNRWQKIQMATHEFGHASHIGLQARPVDDGRQTLNDMAHGAGVSNKTEVGHVMAHVEGVADSYERRYGGVDPGSYSYVPTYGDVGHFKGAQGKTYDAAFEAANTGERVPTIPDRKWKNAPPAPAVEKVTQPTLPKPRGGKDWSEYGPAPEPKPVKKSEPKLKIVKRDPIAEMFSL